MADGTLAPARPRRAFGAPALVRHGRRLGSLLASCLLLAACSGQATPSAPRMVAPPTLVVITPTVIAGGPLTPADPPTAVPGTSGGAAGQATAALPSRGAAPGSSAPTLPPVTATPGSTTNAPPVATVPPSPTSTPDPNAPRAVRLTAAGCCPLPQWLSAEGVSYYGTVQGQTGTWTVPRGGGTARLISRQYGSFSSDGQLVAYPDGATTHVARLDGTVLASWKTEGRVYLSPQTGLAAWLTPAGDVQAASVSLDPPVRVAIGTIATGASATLPPAFSTERLQWFPDGRRLLLSGRAGNGDDPGLWVLDTATGQATRIVAGRGLEQPLISPDGRTIAYTATLQDDRATNGLWLVDADGGNRRKLPFAGGYRWSPDGASLLYVPVVPDQPGDELWRYRLADGSRTPVVTQRQLLFQIAQNEWEVAPNGNAITFRSATDGAIWVVSWP